MITQIISKVDLPQNTLVPVWWYTTYGLYVCSDFPLPELTPATSTVPADVAVHMASVTHRINFNFDLETESVNWVDNRTANFYYQDAGVYSVRDGREIIIYPQPHADAQTIRFYLLGVAMGLLLHQRGELALHASATVVNDIAIAFIGESGHGKSTLAAHLHAKGHHLITDDILVVRTDDSGFVTTVPGYPILKLWPDTLLALGNDPELHLPLGIDYEKRICLLRDGFTNESHKIMHIYVLDYGPGPTISLVKPSNALLELIRNTYALRFIGSKGSTADHFQQCNELLDATLVFRLQRPRNMEMMEQVVELIEANCGLLTNRLVGTGI